MKNAVWFILRLVITYLLLPSIWVILTISNSASLASSFLDAEITLWLTAFWGVIGYILLRFKASSNFGRYFIVSVFGALVLIMYRGEAFSFNGMKVYFHTAFLAATFSIMLIFFIFPHRNLRPLLFLAPVLAGSWFLVWVGYKPAGVIFEVFQSKASIPKENFSKLIEFLPGILVSNFVSGVIYMCLIMPFYILARWGHNPKNSYQSLTKRLRQIRNARQS
ncbi:hypothetical protein F0231_20770 [Vibrio sp. RE86]|uniref:hypothetical protein n=1 Tax=Vibrio sp. RE86 TaxID=2607605 RepID=UPI001493A66D|nr:hypothetical protein [Vibrio sp. RE86]NOH82145.1 hypothetical protein [Vibrio sp. RE86]